MPDDQEGVEEMNSVMTQLETEVEILAHAVDNIDRDYESEYSEQVIRSELQQIGDLVEAFSEIVGEGEAISVADVPIIEEED